MPPILVLAEDDETSLVWILKGIKGLTFKIIFSRHEQKQKQNIDKLKTKKVKQNIEQWRDAICEKIEKIYEELQLDMARANLITTCPSRLFW